MSASDKLEDPKEVFLARMAEKRRARMAREAAAAEAAKPKAIVTVSEKMAQAIKVNPESLRVSAKGADNTTVVDRPRRTEMLEVVAVDGQGRPSRVARVDCATGERSLLDYVDGYRQLPSVEHVYDPLAALKGDGE
jgi:hypothetical protein